MQLAKLPEAGVPNAGVTNDGLLDKTTEPEPVEVVTPVPPLATGSVPVTPVVRGKPVAFVSVALEGVPKAGVTSVGEEAKTTAPEPVLDEILMFGVVPPLEASGDEAVTPVIVPPEPVAEMV